MNGAQLWPADQVERWPIERLIPYARNAREHSDAQIAQIAASIQEWGWTVPVLADEQGGLIAGHGRVLAARKLSLPDVPVMVARGWSDAQKRAYIIADNKLAENASWNVDLLGLELGELQELDFDLGLTGFGDLELGALLAEKTEGNTDPDDVPPIPEHPVSQPGDLWVLGRHRLLCGDSTVATDVERLMDGMEADLCFTSPPYAQQRDYKTGPQDWDALMHGVFSILPVKHGAQILVNLGLVHRDCEWLPYWDGWIEWMRSAGWRRYGWYVWDQGFGLPGDWNGRLAPSHEFVFHFNRAAERARKTKDKNPENINARAVGASTMRGKDGKTRKFSSPEASAQPTKIADSVIRINRQVGRISADLDHPAVFPVGLPREMIEAFSDPNDVVVEPFSGSGTTIIAAETTGRACHAIELAPAYVDVAVKRWQDFTGKAATLDGDGQTFDEIKAAREAPQAAAAD